MRPIQRKFVLPTRSVTRVDLAVRPDPATHPSAEVDYTPSEAACEVREMEGRLGRIEWRDSVREWERSFEETSPTPLM